MESDNTDSVSMPNTTTLSDETSILPTLASEENIMAGKEETPNLDGITNIVTTNNAEQIPPPLESMSMVVVDRMEVTELNTDELGENQGTELSPTEQSNVSSSQIANEIVPMDDSAVESNLVNPSIIECANEQESCSLQVDAKLEDSATTGHDEVLEDVSTGENESISTNYYYWKYELTLPSSPKFLIGTKDNEFINPDKDKKSAKYLKGCKWAPDGSCLISCSDDDKLRIFNFPTSFSSVQDWNSDDCLPDVGKEEWGSALTIKEGGLIYDYCWYPLMSSMDAVSSCFLSTSSEAPIHLWDAFTGKLRASYQPFNHLEQLVSARSLAFDPTGNMIYSGFHKSIRIFNITRPGRECVERTLKQEQSELNQYGIIASICVNPALKSFYAVGSFDKTIGLYYEDGSVVCLLQGHVGGITHMKFSSDGMKLFTGGRNDNKIYEWDMRNMQDKYNTYDRVVTTHQRIYFDVTPNDRYLITGGTDGIVRIYDLESESTEPCCTFKANSDCVNGVSCNPYIPLLATSSGQRHFLEIANDSDDEEMFVKSDSSRLRSCDIKLWKVT